MKYVQPYGIADPNGSYINGNPATGVQGSIPPAMVFENPEREICNLITDSGQTPADVDLRQLGKGVQRFSMNYANDSGTANTYAVTLAPVPDGYNAGFLVVMKVGNTNTGPSTLNVNSRGPKNIVHVGAIALRPDSLLAGMIAVLVYDGTNFQIVGAVTEKLFAPRDYYVNPTGSDTNSGLTAGSPFQTIQKAIDTTNSINLNGFDVTIHCADGTYPASAGIFGVWCKPLNGSGNVYILGNLTTPASCLVNRSVAGPAIYVDPGARNYNLRGFKLAAAASSGGNIGCGIRCPGAINLSQIDFGTCASSHVLAEQGGQVGFDPSTRFYVSGNASEHLFSFHSGQIIVNNPDLTITGTPALANGFWRASMCAVIDGSYNTQTGSVSAGTKKFSSELNAAINAGTTTLQGGVAGTQTDGGVYKGP